MNEPNETILVHKGEFELVKNEFRLRIEGELYFSWAPSAGVKYKGKVTDGLSSIQQLFQIQTKKFDLYIDGTICGKCHINMNSVSSDGAFPVVAGNISGSAIKGDKSIPVDTVRFGVPNLRDFFGELVQDETWGGRNRLSFANKEYLITLDKRRDFKEALEKLREKGGYILTYYGELKSKNGSIKYNELSAQIRSFLTFLTF